MRQPRPRRRRRAPGFSSSSSRARSSGAAAEAAAPSSRRHGGDGREAPAAVSGRRGRVPRPRLCSSGGLPPRRRGRGRDRSLVGGGGVFGQKQEEDSADPGRGRRPRRHFLVVEFELCFGASAASAEGGEPGGGRRREEAAASARNSGSSSTSLARSSSCCFAAARCLDCGFFVRAAEERPAPLLCAVARPPAGAEVTSVAAAFVAAAIE